MNTLSNKKPCLSEMISKLEQLTAADLKFIDKLKTAQTALATGLYITAADCIDGCVTEHNICTAWGGG